MTVLEGKRGCQAISELEHEATEQKNYRYESFTKEIVDWRLLAIRDLS